MNAKYTIKNFKIFDKEGTEFDIRPITVLTGCNSSGKSSVVKSILALDKFLSVIKNDNEGRKIELSSFYNYPMHFNAGQLKLGRYDCVLNRESANDNTMTFGYTIESGLAARKFHVEYVFEASKNIFNDARLHDIKIFTEDGVKVLDNEGLNILPLRDAFFKKLIYDHHKRLINRINDTESFGDKNGYGNKLLSLQAEYDKFSEKYGNNLTAHERYCFKPGSFEEYKKNYSTSFELGASILKLQSLYSMPALETLVSVSKDNFLSEFIKVTPSEFQGKAEWVKLAQSIADDFRKSEYDTFGTYFRSLEEKEVSNKMKKTDERLDISIYGFLMSQIDEVISYSDIESETVSFRIIARALYLCSLSDGKFSHSLLSRQDRMSVIMLTINNLLPSVAAFSEYAEKIIHELLLPPFVSNVNYIGSSRAEIKRLYSVDDRGSDFDDLVVEYENQKHLYAFSDNNLQLKHVLAFRPGMFLNKWLKNFSIADSMSFKNIGDGAGIMIYLHRNKDDIKGHLLADEGYGITQLISILLGIEISIMKGRIGKFYESRDGYYEQYQNVNSRLLHDYNIQLDELACPLEATLLIEEPETHLHPKYQSMLAEMFLDAYITYNIQFVIETHSEYLIRKFQTFVAKYDGGRILSEIISEADSDSLNGPIDFNCKRFAKTFRATMGRDEISVYYLYEKDEQPECESFVKKLELKEDGRFASQFGPGFFDEADNLAMDLLSIKMQKL